MLQPVQGLICISLARRIRIPNAYQAGIGTINGSHSLGEGGIEEARTISESLKASCCGRWRGAACIGARSRPATRAATSRGACARAPSPRL